MYAENGNKNARYLEQLNNSTLSGTFKNNVSMTTLEEVGYYM